MMIRPTIHGLLALVLIAGTARFAPAHDRETTSVTWSQTISRIMIDRCGACHHEGGPAFSLLTYDDARPWAVAIRDEIMARTMPPWGAVRGFGDFRNDMALSPAQTNLIISWVEGGVPEGNAADLPAIPEFEPEDGRELPADAIFVSGDHALNEPLTLDGLWPRELPAGASFQVVAEFPEGFVAPLLWLYEYREMYSHPFLFERPLVLPAGTVIRGVPNSVTIALIPDADE